MNPLNAKVGKRKNFTILELFIVIAIISIMMSAVFIILNEYQVRARDTQRLGTMRELMIAVELYHLEHGKYPTDTARGFGWYRQADTDSWNNFMVMIEKYLSRPIIEPNLNLAHQYHYFSNGRDYKVRVRLERPSHELVDPLYDSGSQRAGGMFNGPDKCINNSGRPTYEKAIYTPAGACFGM